MGYEIEGLGMWQKCESLDESYYYMASDGPPSFCIGGLIYPSSQWEFLKREQ